MIPDEPEEDPEEDPMEYQDDDGELTEVGVLCLEYVFNGYLAKIQKGIKVPEGHGVFGHTLWQIPAVLEGYSDASLIAKNSRSNGCSGNVFTLGGGVVSWKSAKQTLITRSTFEAALCVWDTTGTEAEWLFGLLSQLPIAQIQGFVPFDLRVDQLDRKNKILNWEVGALKADHNDEVEQLQQENQQLRDQVNDLRDHIDQLVEMILDEPEEDPEEDPMKCQDDDGELTKDSVID
ncbi:UNVERIFIED_CONTAM: hypothetical protein Scaly_2899700 [Sesamum calycinum]|uniref:Uncharacterized protein n=1 Tax=Sesamum calycinum TaxID=2727403 RepID=A0AAW2L6L4_9LAMI